MFRKLAISLAVAAALAGCATGPVVKPTADLPWQDARFAYDPALVTLTGDDIFRLHPELAALLSDPELMQYSVLPRARHLLTLLFGPKRDLFGYEAGHSTIAAQSWERRRGDCISLTVLAYAAAKALKLDAEVQEVKVPALYVRRGSFEYINHHVNLRIKLPGKVGLTGLGTPHHMIIDFEPDVVPGQIGQPLTETQVIARMYSNLGVEAFSHGDRRHAYAYMKAAIARDLSHAPSYTNLAMLYRQDGLQKDAEALLRRGISLGKQPEVAMRALIDMLDEQGRKGESQVIAEQLRKREEADPYYWIGRGAAELAEGHVASAVRALEKAQEMSDGFVEVHRHLAIAYLKAGKRDQAKQQLALLAKADSDDPLPNKLRRYLAP